MNTPTIKDFGNNFTKWDLAMRGICVKMEIPFYLMKTIGMIESSLGLHPRVAHGLLFPADIDGSKSEDGKSWGLLQMRVTTAKDYDKTATAEKLNNVDYALSLGGLHLRHLDGIFKHSEEFTVKAWNQGEGATFREKNRLAPGKADNYWAKYQLYKGLLT